MYNYKHFQKKKTQKNRNRCFNINKKKLFIKNTIFYKNILFLENKNFKRKFLNFKKKFFKKKYKIFLILNFNNNITKKSKNSRMGKGKGKIKNIFMLIKKLNFFIFCKLPKSRLYIFKNFFFCKKKIII